MKRIAASLAAGLLLACTEALSQGRVVGRHIVDDEGRPLTLRGANWGWWGCVESGDALLIRALGGNLVRIAFPYGKIVQNLEEEWPTLGGEGLSLLDRMCGWAQQAGVWFILDCHVPPGGCNPAPWGAGGANALWRDSTQQERFLRMWRDVARRYRHYSRLLAYELMNEPVPPADYPLEEYRQLCLKLIDALRAEDPERPIVVGGLNWNSLDQLTDDLVLGRPAIIYTFHFYRPGSLTYAEGVISDGRLIYAEGVPVSYPGPLPVSDTWIRNSPEDWGPSGDTNWKLLERSFVAPEDATHGQVLLRSTRNAGSSWFDDVLLLCEGESVAIAPTQSFGPEQRTAGWWVERNTAGKFTWDPDEGHSAPGALRIQGTDSYNSWYTRLKFRVRAGARYTVRCWVKTVAATGHTYPCVAWFNIRQEMVDSKWLARALSPALAFRRRHQVPLFCGEFGCSQGLPDGSGQRWVYDLARILNREGIPWTYWNWRETLGPGSMSVWCHNADGTYTLNGPLWETLSKAWRQ